MAGSSPPVRVGGNIISKSRIDVEAGDLIAYISGSPTPATITAASSCAGSISPACIIGPTPTTKTYDLPSGYSVSPAPGPTGGPCNGTLNQQITFHPGLYTNPAVLTNLTGNSGKRKTECNQAVFYFEHGTYYFDFAGTWVINGGYVVGGTKSPSWTGVVPSIPGACQSPLTDDDLVPKPGWNPPEGVEFVFAGSSKLNVTAADSAFPAQVELCGSYSKDRPPITLHGLTQTGVSGLSGPATGCALVTCALLTIDKNADGPFYVQGMTYAPNSTLSLDLKKDTVQTFGHGVIARFMDITGQGNANPANPAFTVRRTTGGSRTVVLLTVYVCPNVSTTTCSKAGGKVRLQAKVLLFDKPGESRKVTVLNWSVRR
jgi:hypothetical protein